MEGVEMIYDIYKDELTGLPNFIKFFTDDFDQVYGERGHLTYLKIKGMRDINDNYGKKVGDDIFLVIAEYLKSIKDFNVYRHEGNGFLIVYKDAEIEFAQKHIKEMNCHVDDKIRMGEILDFNIYSMILSYSEKINSVADYYYLLYDTYLKENNMSDSKELFHFLMERMSFRVNDMIGKYTDTRAYAFIDEISNLPNHKSATVFMNENLIKSANYAILFIDGDSLGKFNQISYETGNRAIYEIAAVISKAIRKTDKVYRWLSGDEFIVIAENTSRSEVEQLSERIRYKVENHMYSLPFSPTVSIGIAIYPENGKDYQEILTNSELANKKAKSNGKNTYALYDGN